MREDYNHSDVFVLLGGLKDGIKGIRPDDLFRSMIDNLKLAVTKDEMFVLFYKLD